MFKKILVPLDGSNMAEAVLPLVRDIATHDQAEIVLFQNLDLNALYGISPEAAVGIDVAAVEQAMRADAINYLEHTAKHLRDRDLTVHVDVRAETSTAGAIMDGRGRHGADLIAMATHGRGGVGRLLLGSTADRVVHQAEVPVLLVRPDESKIA